MAESVVTRLKSAWNAFRKSEQNDLKPQNGDEYSYGMVSSYARPDRVRLTRGNERSIINSVYNRIAMDVAALTINHVRLDENDRFKEIINDGLNKCLNLSANIDQTGRAFLQDIVISLLDEGCIAVVPVDTTSDPTTGSYDILSMRVGKITAWFPQHVRVELYDDRCGRHKEITIRKQDCAIIENPMYSVMNEPNSTLRRLIRKLNILDVVDEQSASGKFNLIVQLPYAVRSEKRRQEALDRQRQIEEQLGNGNKYGVAYIDSAEKVTQLNRALDNNLLTQIEYLTNMLYGQLGITQNIMTGTADEQETLNYNNRAVEPVVSAIVNEFKRKFLTPTAIAQKQSMMFFRDPFKLVPVDNIAEIADKFTRNEIMTKNEFRQVLGMKPSDDPRADELRNANISESASEVQNRLNAAGSVPTGSPDDEDFNVEESPKYVKGRSRVGSILNRPVEEVTGQNG